jgi:hypothetical protein
VVVLLLKLKIIGIEILFLVHEITGVFPPFAYVDVKNGLVPAHKISGIVLTVGTVKGLTVKFPTLVPTPLEFVILINPVVPEPIVAVIKVGELTVKELTFVPPIFTSVTPVKFVPLMLTIVVLGQPTLGENTVIVGLWAKVESFPKNKIAIKIATLDERNDLIELVVFLFIGSI